MFVDLKSYSGNVPYIERIGVYFCKPRSKIRPYEELESLKLGLYDDEAEVGFRIDVASLAFHQINLTVISYV